MDIYILRDGKEIGPFSEETTHTLLKQGSVLINDLAWRPGMADWIPLHSVLYPAPPPAPSLKPPPPPAAAAAGGLAPASEPATGRQKAFLSYMAISFPEDITKDQAALLVNDAMENPRDPGRISRWNEDRLRLHPELFAAEIQARKDNRSNHFYEIAQTKGAECFTKVTKAHCQVLVGHLDVRFPNWDANEEDATWNYFFPAIAEKFPQLVCKEWKGKLAYSTGPKVAPELRGRGTWAKPAKPGKRTGGFPILAAARGLFLGLLILSVLYGGYQGMKRGWFNPKNFAAAPAAPASEGATPASAADPAAPVSAPPSAPPPGGETAPAGETANPPPSAGTHPDDMIAATPSDMSASEPSSSDAPTLDLSEPPTSSGSSSAPPAAVPPAAGVPKTTFVVTKKISVRTRFGPIELIPGNTFKLVDRQGAMVRAQHQIYGVISIPVAATDLEQAAPPPASLF